MSQIDLCDLFNNYGSDKDRNGYAQGYHMLFRQLRDQPITMLEIGIGTMIPGVCSSMSGYALKGYKPGGSLRAWRDYFLMGRIIGADIQPDTQFDDEPRIETYICNSSDPKAVKELINKIGKGSSEEVKFDIIIDDGSHDDMNQFSTLRNFYPYVKEGGYYIIEDVNQGARITTMPGIVSTYCNHDPFIYIGQKNNICAILKDHINTKRLGY